MTINVNGSGDVGSLAQLLAASGSERKERPAMPPPPPPQGANNKMEEDLKSVLAELGLSGGAEESDKVSDSSGSSLETFMASLMDALHAQQEGSKAIAAGSSDNPMKLDLQSLLAQLDGEGEQSSEVSALQSQFSSLLESSGSSGSGVSLKEFLSAFASKIPSDAPDRRGYLVDTQA
ncbi:hypothetical protein [Aeromonas enteropelogenes]|uniref:hypothetical protein n=1 Tax=Aeromonas enteropelogenes TaxID=29489 RepID=UPI003BA1FFCA